MQAPRKKNTKIWKWHAIKQNRLVLTMIAFACQTSYAWTLKRLWKPGRMIENKSNLAKLHEALISCMFEHERIALGLNMTAIYSSILVKERQIISILQDQVTTQQLLFTKDELYEAKRTQLAAAVVPQTVILWLNNIIGIKIRFKLVYNRFS